jgi:D-alanyl-lipoteichoic acid acyltransferase DltB (MBOAT superfamily)
VTFNSLQYAAFFAVVLLVYWRLPRRGQNALLLVASYVFYAAFDYRFLGLLLLSTGLDYWFGLSISRSGEDRVRRRWLFASLCVNLGILGFFKYFDFFADSAAQMLQRVGLDVHPPLLRILLPIGISFYTFHGISYVFDVYRRHIEPSRSLLDYSVFVAFFPQLVAGPIGRAHLQLPQFGRERTRPSRERVVESLVLILTGLFKKVVIADGVAAVVTDGFLFSSEASALTLLFTAWGFALQIYGDFSGYTDIARGSAWLLGIELPINFRQPYLSRSITEFWRRWHVSLSNWLRDYLYIPLGGNRAGEFATYRNLVLTMLLGGLWHGASWTFVVWGSLQGLLLSLDRVRGRDREDVERPIVWRRDLFSILVTANVVALLFVIFRAESLGEAVDFFAGIFTGRGGWAIDLNTLFIVAVAAAGMLLLDVAQRRSAGQVPLENAPPLTAGVTVGLLLVLIVVFSGGTPIPFIYFQF